MDMKRNLKLTLVSVLCFCFGHTVWAEDHFLVGGATASGWNAGAYNRSPVAMVNVSEYLWTWAGKLTVGEGDAGRFKIPSSADGWDGYWAPAQGTVLTSEWSDLSENSSGDYKYCVAEEGIYRIYINTSTKKIKAEKLTEPTKDGDYYQIATVNDYYWFAGKVTSEGSTSAKARLTADLNFSEKGFFPLACDKYKFKGEFDGAGHTISNAVIIGGNNNVAFIRYATGGTNIHDLIIEGSFTGNAKVGGIVGFARDGGIITLTNVINKATVQSTGSTDANAAAFVGCATDNTVITALNCANMGAVSGQNGQCAAFAGWTQSGTTFTNCWNSGAISNIDGTSQLYRNSGAVTATNCFDLTNDGKQGTKVDASTLATGKFCFTLNGDQSSINWYQNMSGTVDNYPVPFSSHAQVYANGELKCDGTSAGGELTYSNSSTSVIPPHTYVNGWCSVCNALDHDYLTADGEGYYSIGSANDLHWFAAMVAEVNQSANAKLTGDIDYTAYKQGFIGTSQSLPFRGIFNGQNHAVTIDIVNNGSGRTGLFAYINAATIRNLIVEGSATSAGNNCVGGLGGRSDGDGTLIENVVVKTDVSYTGTNGDATCGGFFANMEGNVTLQNCAFYGSINTGSAEGNGGLVGWAGGGSNNKYINCIVAPTSYTQNGNSADFARNNATTTNCYKVSGSDARLATGEMTYVMNEAIGETVWYQKIGTDSYPMPFGTDVVYANGYQYCDGTVKSGAYENENKGVVRDEHVYGEWGFCTNVNGSSVTCDQIQPGFATLTDGYYQIGNAKELNWFAVWTNREDASVNAKLTADINMTEVANFPGIGSGERKFTGTIDGQRHIITNMKMDWSREGVGLVNRAANGACVKNVTIASNCSFKGSKAVAALIGGTYGAGDIYIENCGNEAPVQSTGQNAGGIIGCRFNDNICHLTNVYNVGEITGATAGESGSFSGWLSNAVLKNCYSIAGYPTSGNTHGFQEGNQFSRGSDINLDNCYDYGTGLWGQNESTWGDAFADGRKITDPDDETQMGAMFAGLYDAEGGNVWRMEYEGWAHPVLYDPAKKVLSENVPNRFSSENGVDLTLKRTTVAGTWNTICLPFALNATQIASLFGAGAKVAELTGATGETLNFTSVISTVAGKAYLVMPSEVMTEKELTVDLDATAPVATTKGGYAFTGIYEPTAVVANDLFVVAGNKLTPSDGTGKLKAFRAYFHNTGSGARLTNFVIDEETTGIASIEDGLLKVQDAVYDMQGRKVSQLKKGLYIVNGKKQVVK